MEGTHQSPLTRKIKSRLSVVKYEIKRWKSGCICKGLKKKTEGIKSIWPTWSLIWPVRWWKELKHRDWLVSFFCIGGSNPCTIWESAMHIKVKSHVAVDNSLRCIQLCHRSTLGSSWWYKAPLSAWHLQIIKPQPTTFRRVPPPSSLSFSWGSFKTSFPTLFSCMTLLIQKQPYTELTWEDAICYTESY